MFWIIVLLHNLSSLELEITNWWPDILLQDFLIEYRIYGSINNGKSSRLCSCKAASEHYTTTTMYSYIFAQKSNICPKVLGIIKKFLANVRQAIVFFLVNSGFFLGTLPWMSFLPSLFLTVESWTLTLIEASEACRSLDVILFFFFMTSWMRHYCALGVILVGQPLLGRFTTVTRFLHLWIMALTMVRWSPKALEITL